MLSEGVRPTGMKQAYMLYLHTKEWLEMVILLKVQAGYNACPHSCANDLSAFC
jgi:hypothetical protein